MRNRRPLGLQLLLLLCFSLSSCKWWGGSDDAVPVEFKKVDMKASFINPKVPELLWTQIDEYYKKVNPVDEYSALLDREKANVDPPKKVFDVKIQLIENTGSVLGAQNYLLDFGSSGTYLDLKDFVSLKEPGSFYWKFQILPQFKEGEGSIKVYHLSGVEVLKVGNEVLGGGCNQLRDISKIFQGAQEKGILVSTVENRHVSLLTGTFVFVAVMGETLYFSSLSVEDSRFSRWSCRR